MKTYFSDVPIKKIEEDKYGISPFAFSLAQSIKSIENPVGTTIALNGPWGSGKSSAVNLIRAELESRNDPNFIISEFKCWWYRGEEALALAFLQNLNSILSEGLKDKVKDLIPQIGQSLLQAGPVVSSAMSLTPAGFLGPITGATMSFAKRFFPKGDTLEKTFKKLAKILEEENRKFLIIIDDIDRLSPEEALAIFRMVKSVGRLPNVMYLLVFDRALADRAVEEFYPSEGPHFLEKIIQAGFELPAPLRIDLNRALLSSIELICGSPDEKYLTRTMNLFHDVVAHYLTTPRHVVRFQNAISVTWPAIAKEVSLADYIALETLRLYEPNLFQSIRSKKSKLCGISQRGAGGDQRGENRFNEFLEGVDVSNHIIASNALQRLFPRLENTVYGGEWTPIWDSERRICIETHFDTYFRLSLSQEALPIQEIQELVARADNVAFIQETFRDAAQTVRPGGSTMVPVLLAEMNTHADQVEKHKVRPLLNALFEIHDDIDLEIDEQKGFLNITNTTFRYHWLIRRLTGNRFNLDERTDLYLSIIPNASLGWAVDFVSSSIGQYRDREEGSRLEEDFLVREDTLDDLVNVALPKIRTAASDNTLLHHKDLIYILYRWRDFLGEAPDEVSDWTDRLIRDREGLVTLAKKLTGERWSHGIGMSGLGDRVSRRTLRANINSDTEILDVDRFREGLRNLVSENNCSAEDLKIVTDFLSAWEQQEESDIA